MTNSLQDLDDYSYVIGIDFGTTFSGCCYAFTKDTFDDFQDVTSWPKQRNSAYPKTPTVLLYKENSQEVLAWGDAAKCLVERPNVKDHLLERFKLYLDEASASTLPELPNGLLSIQVIADYLNLLHSYICEHMKKGFAQNYDQHQFRYCLTIPAQWTDRAKTIMREAAILAGIIKRQDPTDRLMLISEPEAAALYCQKTCDQFQLGHGQRFMICDAGGGTVDLIVFEIDDGGQRRSLKEVTKGSGDTCGSTFLDRNMEKLIRQRFEHFGEVKPKSLDQMMTVFIERVKPQFDDDDEDHFIPIPFSLGYPHQDNEEAGIVDGMLMFSAQELKEKVFNPVVEKVIRLIDEQLNGSTLKPVDAIFMVGGFGKSTYLHKCVERAFVPRVQFVGIPPRAEMAVVRGAVYFGLNPKIVSQRVLRRTYGLCSQMNYEPNLDPPENRVMVDNRWYCKQRFSIYARKGQAVGVDECVTKKYQVKYPHSTETDLYAFDDDGSVPRLITDPKVKVVARFPVVMPTFKDLKIGDPVIMLVNMYFGQTEIKIEVIIRNHRQVFTSRLDFVSDTSSININDSSVGSASPTLTTAPPPYSPGTSSPPSSSSTSSSTWPSPTTASSSGLTSANAAAYNNIPTPPPLLSNSSDSQQLYGKPDEITQSITYSKPHFSGVMSPALPSSSTLPLQNQYENQQYYSSSQNLTINNNSQIQNNNSMTKTLPNVPYTMTTTGSHIKDEKLLDESDGKVLAVGDSKTIVTKKQKGFNKFFGKLKKT
ncbi:hypothetical protein BJ944DRAFT_1812 [Cunninghamella echinulata]|nr:hypothetical protein BJ944DRAFT_1812 [Cunninghamella echinulata]